MKKMILFLILCAFINVDAKSSKSSTKNSGHYIINLTGKVLALNFYAKNPFTKKRTWVALETVSPLLFGGAQPANFIDTLNASVLPKPTDMHPLMCYEVTFDIVNTDPKGFSTKDILKYKDSSYKGVSMPTPSISLIPNDYKVELQGKQIVVTRLNTSAGIPIPGTKKSDTKQWPSKEEVDLVNMSAADKLAFLEKEVSNLQGSIEKLNKEIKKYRKNHAITKMNNRKKMRDEKEKLIKKYNKQITDLRAQIAHPTSDASVEENTDTSLSDDTSDIDDTLDTQVDDSPATA